MENKSNKNSILLAVATLALVFGFASSANAGMCDQYEIVPTCTGSGPGSAVNFYNTGGTWSTWNGGNTNTNGNGYYNGNNNGYNNNYNNGYYNNNNGYNNPTIASVTTNNPEQVASYSMKLSGYVQSNTPSTVFFQYGTDQNMNRQTTTQSISNGTVTNNITGLLPNTTYYFRLVADNQAGRATGNTMSITTSPVIYTGGSTGGTVSGSTKDTSNTNSNVSSTTKNSTVSNTTTTSNNTNTTSNDVASNSVQGTSLSANSLSALSVSGTDSFLPDTVFEWICVFFLILVIILLIRQLRPKADHGHAVAH
jgi:hypothetical protein